MGNARSRVLFGILKDSSSNTLDRYKGVLTDKSEEELGQLLAIQNAKIYSFSELLRATDSFSRSNIMGQGGFGNTYKGILPDGTLICIRVVSGGSTQRIDVFKNELLLHSKLEHVNMVKLVGCCVEANRRILVYNYLENGDLARALLGRGPSRLNFTWDVRCRICIGVASGLAFLHDANIVHRDIKASNILLDDQLNPKILKFGTARFLPPDTSHVSENVVGTYGYIAPEYALRGWLTIKADIYSFGVLMLEIISGRRNIGIVLGEGISLLNRAWDLHEKEELLGLVDDSIMGDFDREEAYKYLIICLLCTQDNPDLRPDSSTLIGMLTDKIDVSGERLSIQNHVSQYRSTRSDEDGKHGFESNTSFSPKSIGEDCRQFSGPLRKHKKDGTQSLIYSKEVESSYPESTTSLLTVFTYKKIKKITRNFKHNISAGRYKTYWGTISKDLRLGPEHLQVAVKIYDDDIFYQDKHNWLAQISLFRTLSHPNLVRLIGHCYEAKHWALVYEYMAHGSLEDKLFSREQSPLSWDVRINIAVDSARGLTHLHKNERPIIHRNIKPSNILLDTVYSAKIFGFGLAIAGPEDYESEISKIVAGTPGYIDPEYIRTGRVSTKSDVYSFGVVLVELLSGRKWKDLLSEEPAGLVPWILKFLEEGESLHEFMDARLMEDYPIQGARAVAELAHKCLDGNPQQRPSMREIADSLKHLLEPDTSSHIAGVESEVVGNMRKFERVSGSTSQSQAMNLETQRENRGSILMHVGFKLTEAPGPKEWMSAKEIYIMQSQVTELPERPSCPELKALYLHRNYKLRTIPISFFEFMPVLQVLNLSRTRIKTLPDSLFGLCYLKRLFLNHCELLTVLSPKIGELKHLEVLDLHGTEIVDLPKEVVNLTSLRCLELSFCGDLNPESNESMSNLLIPRGAIRAFSQLEELSIDVDPEDERWEKTVTAILDDICCLRMLNTLKLYFPYVEHLTNINLYSMPVERFKFIMGHHANRIMSRFPQDLEYQLEQWDRCLQYINGVGIPSDVKKVLNHSTAFFLDRHTTMTELSKFGIENMHQLKCCVLGECNEVCYLLDGVDFSEKEASSEIVSEYLFDGHILGSLEYLHMYYMRSLRGIYTGPYKKCLRNLKSLTLQTCPRLAIIFTPDLLRDLSNLEELTVEDCEAVTSLVTVRDSIIHGSSCFLHKLKRISLHYLPQLVSISHGLHLAPELEMISLQDCPNLSLSMEEVGSNLTKIKGQTSLSFSSMSSSVATQSRSSEGNSAEIEVLIRSLQGNSAEGKDENSKASKGKLVEGKSKESWSLKGKPVEGIAGREVTCTSKLRAFTFAELQSATGNFEPVGLLEDGAYGTVFKGYLDENVSQFASYGGTWVAVKVLTSESMIFYRDLVSELDSWGSPLSHPNVVRLLGYCGEDDARFFLVYEYMRKGTLENHLFKGFAGKTLSWKLRLKIAKGIAEGLAFLHRFRTPIFDWDIKASDILLDAEYNAKISYFDWVIERERLMGDHQSHVSTRVMGTYGYAAPEYVATGRRNAKSVTYSFGAVLLEMLTGRRAMDTERPAGQHSLVEWVKPHVSKRKLAKVVDPRLGELYPLEDALAVAKLAIDCLRTDPEKRPLMTEARKRLKKIQILED